MRETVPVSVVVPTVSRPAELVRCLEALLGADVLPSEVLVIDQGRRPETARAVAALGERASVPVVHLTSDRRGLSAARNLGLRHVAHAWVAFIDDDCVPSSSWTESLHRRLSAAEAPDGVGGRVLPLGEAMPGTFTLSLRVSQRAVWFRGRALPWRVGTGGNMAVRVDTLRSAGGYDERLGTGTAGRAGEDLELIHRLLRRGAVMAFDPEVVVRHDRVGPARRLATRDSYGFGMGAFVGVWLRTDPWVAYALARWLWVRGTVSVRALVRRDLWRLREERLLVAGALAGLRYGIGLRSVRSATPPDW